EGVQFRNQTRLQSVIDGDGCHLPDEQRSQQFAAARLAVLLRTIAGAVLVNGRFQRDGRAAQVVIEKVERGLLGQRNAQPFAGAFWRQQRPAQQRLGQRRGLGDEPV